VTQAGGGTGIARRPTRGAGRRRTTPARTSRFALELDGLGLEVVPEGERGLGDVRQELADVGSWSGSGTSGGDVSSCSSPSMSPTLHTMASRIGRPWLTSTRCEVAVRAPPGLHPQVDGAESRDPEVVAGERRRPSLLGRRAGGSQCASRHVPAHRPPDLPVGAERGLVAPVSAGSNRRVVRQVAHSGSVPGPTTARQATSGSLASVSR
jgi:hypothetical protein